MVGMLFRRLRRKMTLKLVGLRRALCVLLFMCGILIFFLVWHQEAPLPVSIPKTLRHNQRPPIPRSPVPYAEQPWTWKCVNQRCEKQAVASPDVPVAVNTCNMLCKSTQLWPQPTGPVTLGSKAATFHYRRLQFESTLTGPARELLNEALTAFNSTILNMVRQDYPETVELDSFLVKVYISRDDVKLQLTTDESYNLTLKTNTRGGIEAAVSANTFFGARHGLETLSQLIWWDEFANTLKVVKGATVQDKPAFPYRGVMLDTARNFIPVEDIKRVLTGMAANKLNAFHWHITDSQSFPYKSTHHPQFAKLGAYAPDKIYTEQDIADVVKFAASCGIRVVIEIDTPAHVGNGWTWGPSEGLGDLAVCVNEQPWSLYCGEPPCGQINPQNPNTYKVLENLYKEILTLTGDNELFHLGGDEVNLECWSQHLQWNVAELSKTPGTTLFNYTDLHDLWGEFTLKALQRLAAANGGKKPPNVIVWSSNLSKKPYTSKYLDKSNIVVQVWGPSQWTDTIDLLMEGYRLILSHVDAWYLDCGFGRWRETGEAACDPYRPWQTVYNHRPWQQPHINRKQILGAEVCLWSEQLDLLSLDGRLWPRTAAFAERVWHDPPLNAYDLAIAEDVYTRLQTQRNRLVERGIGAEAMWPLWCAQNPGMCL